MSINTSIVRHGKARSFREEALMLAADRNILWDIPSDWLDAWGIPKGAAFTLEQRQPTEFDSLVLLEVSGTYQPGLFGYSAELDAEVLIQPTRVIRLVDKSHWVLLGCLTRLDEFRLQPANPLVSNN